MAVQHRRKLFVLVDHAGNRIGIDGTEHPVDYHGAHRHLAFVRLVARFAVDQVCQQIPVVLRKGHFRNIPPAGLSGQPGFGDFLFQLLFQRRDILFLLADLFGQGVRMLLRCGYLVGITGDAAFGTVDAVRNLSLLYDRRCLQLV